MSDVLYINGPVQNGPFTLVERPGKAAGIRAAEALNTLLSTGPAPHLWNTVTLAGDLRHRDAPTGTPSAGRRGRNERSPPNTHRARPRSAAFSPTPRPSWPPSRWR
jgi:hypothetical protein